MSNGHCSSTFFQSVSWRNDRIPPLGGNLLFFIILLEYLYLYNSTRARFSLTKSAILPPRLSPWNQILRGADSQSFIVLVGMTRLVFNKLTTIIFPDDGIVISRGRKSILNIQSQLGLALFYLNSKMDLKHLCLILGVSPTTASENIRRTIRRIISFLNR